MEAVKDNSKKNLIAPYQQSFRIDDLLTRKVIDQQPGHLPHPLPTTATFQPPPIGLLSGHHHMEKPPPIDIGAGVVNGAGYTNGKSLNGKTNESSNCEENCKGVTKRSYSSTSNEDEDDLYQKRKKARTAFSREQVADLEKKFQEKKYLSSAERGELAEKLKLSDMQVKTWFQNRRMKYKRQSEEAEMEMKSPKYPYSPFMPYGGVSPFYSYVPMPYKSHEGGGGSNIVPYNNYPGTTALRSPQTTSPISSGGMDANFVINSPTMLGSLSSPLSAGVSPRHHGLSASLPRPNGGTSYFNGLLTPISPSTSYQHSYFVNESGGSGSNHTQIHGFSEWPRAVPAPTTP